MKALANVLESLVSDLPDLNEAEDRLRDQQEEENRLRTQIGAALQNVNVLDTLKERKELINTRRTELSLQIARLKSLERAFSKDGVPALLIEQALPEIEAQANDILDRLSAGGMSVRFNTQRGLQGYQTAATRKKRWISSSAMQPASASMNYSPAAKLSGSILPSGWRFRGCWPSGPAPGCKPWSSTKVLARRMPTAASA